MKEASLIFGFFFFLFSFSLQFRSHYSHLYKLLFSLSLFLQLPASSIDFPPHESSQIAGKAWNKTRYRLGTMLRSSATRSLLRSFTKVPTTRSTYTAASPKFNHASLLRTLSNSRPQVLPSTRPTAASVFYATKSGPPFDKIDETHEHEVAEHKIQPHPDEVSEGSSVRHVFEEAQAPKDQHGGLRADLETIKDTFALTDVPKESLYIGAAGVLPYAATSLSTVYLAYDINHAHATGQGYLFSPETAHQLLDLITPIQVGYGAVVRINYDGANAIEDSSYRRLFLSSELSTGA